jgi:hypothetical protein
MTYDPWRLLDLPHDATERDVKRRYAQLLKINRPDDDPARFAMLRHAYEACLARASAMSTSRLEVELAPSVPDATTSIIDASAAPLAVERLRDPASVVDELLRAAAPGRDEPFAAWFMRCPELVSIAARATMERELLLRIADTVTAIDDDAFSVLIDAFGWTEGNLEARLLEQGMHERDARRIAAALEPALIDAHFARHLASGVALYAPGASESKVLGDAERERALLVRLHAERRRTPGLLRTFSPREVLDVNALVYAYATRHGAAAIDRLFGVDAMNRWRNLHPQMPTNSVQVVLRLLRVLFFVAPTLAVWTLFTRGYPPETKPTAATLALVWVVGCAIVAVFALGLTASHWWRTVGGAAWRAHRARVRESIDILVGASHALPLLVVVGSFVLWSLTQSIGTAAATGVSLALVAYLFGARVVLGAAIFTGGLATGFAFCTPDATPAFERLAGMTPALVWFVQHFVRLRAPHADAAARAAIVYRVLATLGTLGLLVGVALA